MTTSYKRISESVEDLLAKSHYMVAKCQVDGNLTFDGHSKTTEELDNESRCRSLCLRIEKALAECAPEEITGLLEMYEVLYRIGYASQPSQSFALSNGSTDTAPSQSFMLSTRFVDTAHLQSFMAEQYNRVYSAWRSGNRNIQESHVYPLLKRSINGRPFAQVMLKNWIKTLLKHNRFPNVTTHENYRRLTIVMRENIDRLVCADSHLLQFASGTTGVELKRNWYEANRVDDLSTLSTPLLKSYRTFIVSLFPSVFTYKEQQELDAEILRLLNARPDTNYWDKKAYLMAFQRIPALI